VSGGEPIPGIGTVYRPEPEPVPNGPVPATGRAQLRALPRRRRPGMIALAVALVGVGILASAALYQRADHQLPVLLVIAPVPVGSTITGADIGTTTVAAGPGLDDIPARELRQVVGLVAATSLRPGTLLASSELTSSLPPAPGQVLVPVALRPSSLPASGLAAGDHVDVVATPGDQGQSGASGTAPALVGPVPAIVEAVNLVTDEDGFDVVDLLVQGSFGAAVAKQASTGQFALIVTSRGSG
jgi:hypothetical protein